MDGPTLRSLRTRWGMTQACVAMRLLVGVRTHNSWETGQQRMTLTNIRAIERFALTVAIEKADPSLVPDNVRDDALKLAYLIRGN